jgi:hypothetical protein
MRQRKFAIPIFLMFFLVAVVYAESTPEKCADCHSDSVAFKQWQKSGHANSLKTLLKDQNAGRSCLKCHSADYKSIQTNPWMSTRDLPAPKTASNAVACSACHRHDTGMESNLLMPAEKLCTTCHVRACGG